MNPTTSGPVVVACTCINIVLGLKLLGDLSHYGLIIVASGFGRLHFLLSVRLMLGEIQLVLELHLLVVAPAEHLPTVGDRRGIT